MKVWGSVCRRMVVVLVGFICLGSVVPDANAATAEDSVELQTLQPVLAAGPLQATAEQLTKLVEELDAKPRGSEYRHEGMDLAVPLATEEDSSWKNQILSSAHYRFLASGELRTTIWAIARPQSQDELANVAQLHAEWSPWHEQRPQLEARVITPDGEIIVLDAAQVVEHAGEASTPGVLMDRKALTAVLSGVQPGAIVETKTVLVSQPLMERAIGFQHVLASLMPTRIQRLVISGEPGVRWSEQTLGEVPPAMPWTAEGIADSAEGIVESAEETEYRLVDAPGLFEWFEPGCGPRASSYPLLFAAVTSDWEQLGAMYGKRIDQAISQGDQLARQIVSAMQPADIKADVDARDPKISWAVQQLQQMVRYTGLSLGENAIFPVSPDRSLQRRFGDCKDQSTLLVAWLRQMDIPAHVALLNTGAGPDVPQEMACLDFFDHAIVAIPDETRPGGYLFIDPTITIPGSGDYPVGFLASDCRHRMALVCDASGGKLVQTPGSETATDVETRVNWMDLNRNGGGAMSIELRRRGGIAVELAAEYDSTNRQPMIEQWRQYAQTETGAELASLSVLPLTNDPQGRHRFAVRGSGHPAQLLTTQGYSAFGTLAADEDFLVLDGVSPLVPADLWQRLQGSGAFGEDSQTRRTALVNLEGSTHEVVYGVRFPAGVTLPPLPADWQQTIGFLTFSSQCRMLKVADLKPRQTSAAQPSAVRQGSWETWQSADAVRTVDRADNDQVLQVTFRCVIRPATLSAAEVNEAYEQLRAWYEGENPLHYQLTLDWNLGKRLASSNDNDDLRELAEIASQEARQEVPRAFLAAKLDNLGMSVLAHRLISDVTVKRVDEQLVGRLALQVRQLQLSPDTTRIRLDIPSIKQLAEQTVAPLGGPSQAVMAAAIMRSDDGLISTDQEQVARAVEPLRKLVENPAAHGLNSDASETLQLSYVLALLTTHQDASLKTFLRTRDGIFYPLLIAVLEDREPEVLRRFDADLRQRVVIQLWEQLLAANRVDLAWRLQNLVAEVDWPTIRLQQDRLPELPPLDEQDAESVARHLILADLETNVPVIQQLACVPQSAAVLLKASAGGYSEVHRWVSLGENFRSRWLTQTVAANATVDLHPVSESLQKATLKYSDDQAVEYWLIKDAAGKWRFAPQPRWLGEPLWQQWADGQHEQVQLALETLMPLLAKELPWFDQFSGSYAARVWMRLRDQESLRTEWTVRVMACETTGDLERIDAAEQAAPPQIELWVQRLRMLGYRINDDYRSLYPILLEQMQEQMAIDTVRYFLACVSELQRLYPEEERDDSVWRDRVDEFIADLPDSAIKRDLQYHYTVVTGQPIAALDALQAYLAEQQQAVGVDELANTLLWDSLMIEDTAQVAKRLRVAEAKIDRSNFASAHTLACAQALVGQWIEASEIYRRRLDQPLALFGPSMELLNGLVAMELGLSEVARTSFQTVCTEEPRGQAVTIIRRHAEAVLKEGDSCTK
ncbi:DUF3857 domain-containing transglutaminase family protein [Roseimaritima sediminicola]|uniref:DUF3857 domain-containing transglutaminase family protein n=1 Tax=Roseimaritima sediminicola TaxID=2662066 RepID=UPI0012983E53|nr:DUF3857 domain-containing transglutaminase family protein [Roseimaritima sediminicola]